MSEIPDFDQNASVFGSDKTSAEAAADIRRDQAGNETVDQDTDPATQAARVRTDRAVEQARTGELLKALTPQERQELRALQIKIGNEGLPDKPAVSDEERARFRDLQGRFETRGAEEGDFEQTI